MNENRTIERGKLRNRMDLVRSQKAATLEWLDHTATMARDRGVNLSDATAARRLDLEEDFNELIALLTSDLEKAGLL